MFALHPHWSLRTHLWSFASSGEIEKVYVVPPTLVNSLVGPLYHCVDVLGFLLFSFYEFLSPTLKIKKSKNLVPKILKIYLYRYLSKIEARIFPKILLFV